MVYRIERGKVKGHWLLSIYSKMGGFYIRGA